MKFLISVLFLVFSLQLSARNFKPEPLRSKNARSLLAKKVQEYGERWIDPLIGKVWVPQYSEAKNGSNYGFMVTKFIDRNKSDNVKTDMLLVDVAFSCRGQTSAKVLQGSCNGSIKKEGGRWKIAIIYEASCICM